MKINKVMIGAGEPKSGGTASTPFDGRLLVYENGNKELCENQNIVQQKYRNSIYKFLGITFKPIKI